MNIAFCTASINTKVLTDNLLQSEILDKYKIQVMHGFKNVPDAYDKGTIILHLLKPDIIVFVHDDVYIPSNFEEELKTMLTMLPENWGVLGVAGATVARDKKPAYLGNVMDRGKVWGKPLTKPEPVQTLDELMIIVNMKHGLKFDEQFPLDFYGADICMQATEKGFGVYAIQAFVNHNSSREFGGRTPGFYESEAKFKEKWKHRLPIATTCTILK